MPVFRCDFLVRGDLVLPKDGPALSLNKTERVSIFLHNADVDDEGHVKSLRAVVVGPADCIEEGERTLRSYLTQHLDLLTFVTQSRFEVVNAIRLIEWEPFQRKRRMLAYGSRRDVRYPPSPDLSKEFSNTVAAINHSDPPAFVRTALRQYRYALLSDQQDDQFMRLWLALEIIAENLKEKERVPIECPTCRSNLQCSACGPALRMPMAKQAIESLFKQITGPDWHKKVSTRQFTARNGLMHGSTTESIETKCKLPFEKIVDELGALVRQAVILSMAGTWNVEESVMAFGESITAGFLTPSATLQFDHKTDNEQPSDEALPSVQISILTRFRTLDREEQDNLA